MGYAVTLNNEKNMNIQNDIARLRLKNNELKGALRELMEFSPREYWDGVGDNLHKKTAGAALLMTLDKCEAALRDDA